MTSGRSTAAAPSGPAATTAPRAHSPSPATITIALAGPWSQETATVAKNCFIAPPVCGYVEARVISIALQRAGKGSRRAGGALLDRLLFQAGQQGVAVGALGGLPGELLPERRLALLGDPGDLLEAAQAGEREALHHGHWGRVHSACLLSTQSEARSV